MPTTLFFKKLADLGCWRQRRVQGRRVIKMIAELISVFFSNAKTHWRCAADCIRYALRRYTPKARRGIGGDAGQKDVCREGDGERSRG